MAKHLGRALGVMARKAQRETRRTLKEANLQPVTRKPPRHTLIREDVIINALGNPTMNGLQNADDLLRRSIMHWKGTPRAGNIVNSPVRRLHFLLTQVEDALIERREVSLRRMREFDKRERSRIRPKEG